MLEENLGDLAQINLEINKKRIFLKKILELVFHLRSGLPKDQHKKSLFMIYHDLMRMSLAAETIIGFIKKRDD
jgi:hypothetical protein